MVRRDRPAFMDRLIKPSAKHLAAEGRSLGIIRPENTRFYWRQKSKVEIEGERQSYIHAARQVSMFDEKLDTIEPSTYHFGFSFTDADGKHNYTCADWEVHATFFRQKLRTSEQESLAFLSGIFNDEYPRKGMLFALGNIAKRPQTWQLLGVLRVDPAVQRGLF